MATSDLFKYDHCPIYQAARRFHSFVMSIVPGRGQRILREQCERATVRAMFLLAESADAEAPENVAPAYRAGKAALHRTRVALQAAVDVGAIKREQYDEANQMVSDLVRSLVPLVAARVASAPASSIGNGSSPELAANAPPSPAPSPVPPAGPIEAPASTGRSASKRPKHAKRPPKPVWQAANRPSYGVQPSRAPSSRPLRVR